MLLQCVWRGSSRSHLLWLSLPSLRPSASCSTAGPLRTILCSGTLVHCTVMVVRLVVITMVMMMMLAIPYRLQCGCKDPELERPCTRQCAWGVRAHTNDGNDDPRGCHNAARTSAIRCASALYGGGGGDAHGHAARAASFYSSLARHVIRPLLSQAWKAGCHSSPRGRSRLWPGH